MIPSVDLVAQIHKLVNGDTIILDSQAYTTADNLAFLAWVQTAWSRLAEEMASSLLAVGWEIRLSKPTTANTAGASAKMQLQLTAQFEGRCQRCLQPVAVKVDEKRDFLLVGSDALAAKLTQADEDVLVISKHFPIAVFLEDELLLGLPLLMLHTHCDEQVLHSLQTRWQGLNQPLVKQDGGVVVEKPNPFALLATLKKTGQN